MLCAGSQLDAICRAIAIFSLIKKSIKADATTILVQYILYLFTYSILIEQSEYVYSDGAGKVVLYSTVQKTYLLFSFESVSRGPLTRARRCQISLAYRFETTVSSDWSSCQFLRLSSSRIGARVLASLLLRLFVATIDCMRITGCCAPSHAVTCTVIEPETSANKP